MSGWSRLGVVALIPWWATCGYQYYQWGKRSNEAGYVDRWVPDKNGAYWDGFPSLGMEQAHDYQMWWLCAAVGVPLVIGVICLVLRWVMAGFRE